LKCDGGRRPRRRRESSPKSAGSDQRYREPKEHRKSKDRERPHRQVHGDRDVHKKAKKRERDDGKHKKRRKHESPESVYKVAGHKQACGEFAGDIRGKSIPSTTVEASSSSEAWRIGYATAISDLKAQMQKDDAMTNLMIKQQEEYKRMEQEIKTVQVDMKQMQAKLLEELKVVQSDVKVQKDRVCPPAAKPKV
jgi:hypothetical protein